MRRGASLSFRCSCGAFSAQWRGRCVACGEWDTLRRVVLDSRNLARRPSSRYAPHALAQVVGRPTPGAVVLLSADPGAGKSTLLAQTLDAAPMGYTSLYVSGEETRQQIRARHRRINTPSVPVLCNVELPELLNYLQSAPRTLLALDSVNVFFDPKLRGAAGGTRQLINTVSQIVRVCKKKKHIAFCVSHVTKDSSAAGPNTLRHLVDICMTMTVHGDKRALQCDKNRFHQTNIKEWMLNTANGFVDFVEQENAA